MLAPYWSSLKNNEFGIADKLNSMPKYVVSSTLKKAEWNNSTIIKANVVEEIAQLKQQPDQRILMSGSATLVQSLMQSDLINEYQFLVHPIIMASNGSTEGFTFMLAGLKALLEHNIRLNLVADRFPERLENAW